MGSSWKSSWLPSRGSSPAAKNLKKINFVSLTIGKKRRNSSPKVAGLGSNPGKHLTPPPPPPRYLSLTDFWRLFSCQKEISKTSLTRFLTDIFGSLCDRNEHQSIFFSSVFLLKAIFCSKIFITSCFNGAPSSATLRFRWKLTRSSYFKQFFTYSETGKLIHRRTKVNWGFSKSTGPVFSDLSGWFFNWKIISGFSFDFRFQFRFRFWSAKPESLQSFGLPHFLTLHETQKKESCLS